MGYTVFVISRRPAGGPECFGAQHTIGLFSLTVEKRTEQADKVSISHLKRAITVYAF